ncbi:MAG: diaminopimelate epimerase [Negativicutes bacterium]|nr:diaminopimelate epimerase [Negativicutes bacterium]
MKFSKWHGCGNDFVVIDAGQYGRVIDSRRAVQMCDRHFGIGADGVIMVGNSAVADLSMRIINSDGSEPEMCGNGVRCLALHARRAGLVSGSCLRVETLAGLVIPEIVATRAGECQVRVDMGEPRLEAAQVPVITCERQFINRTLAVADQCWSASCLSMGNPHCVLMPPDNRPLSDELVRRYGPLVERMDIFPRRTNVEFVRFSRDNEFEMKVWERGAGQTLACGTGACASLVAGVLAGRLARRATVRLDGGQLTVEWDEANNHLFLTGPAQHVFDGYYPLPD